jgi:hypothetical protein
MATTTPNFGWPVPTSTDLVKDGATAIEALGDSIDASLLDLKGGTTGQVLSKTTGTDMDFTWVTTDDANAIQNSIVDAKGDLIAATANDTPARLAVGTNGEMLVADSTAATGLDWKTATEQYPWQTWTPTYNNFTIGNATVIARYQQIGKLVNVFYSAIWGTTTSFTAYPQIFLPVTAARGGYTSGVCYLQDTGVQSFAGTNLIETTTYFQFSALTTSGAYGTQAFFASNTIPFTWTNTDQMIATFSYEAA